MGKPSRIPSPTTAHCGRPAGDPPHRSSGMGRCRFRGTVSRLDGHHRADRTERPGQYVPASPDVFVRAGDKAGILSFLDPDLAPALIRPYLAPDRYAALVQGIPLPD